MNLKETLEELTGNIRALQEKDKGDFLFLSRIINSLKVIKSDLEELKDYYIELECKDCGMHTNLGDDIIHWKTCKRMQ